MNNWFFSSFLLCWVYFFSILTTNVQALVASSTFYLHPSQWEQCLVTALQCYLCHHLWICIHVRSGYSMWFHPSLFPQCLLSLVYQTLSTWISGCSLKGNKRELNNKKATHLYIELSNYQKCLTCLKFPVQVLLR